MVVYRKDLGDCLAKVLPCDWNQKQVVCAVGGGGKTSFVHTLADELCRMGKRVILTTTTHMEWPEDTSCVASEIEEIKKHLDRDGFVIAGTHPCGHRMSGVSEEVFAKMQFLCDAMVIEADGAKRRPLKAPDVSYEPVLPPNTTITVVIGGLNAIGRPIEQVCFRLPQVQRIVGEDILRLLTPEDMAKILTEGYCDIVRQQAKDSQLLFYLNQADNSQRLMWAQQIAKAYPQFSFAAGSFLCKA